MAPLIIRSDSFISHSACISPVPTLCQSLGIGDIGWWGQNGLSPPGAPDLVGTVRRLGLLPGSATDSSETLGASISTPFVAGNQRRQWREVGNRIMRPWRHWPLHLGEVLFIRVGASKRVSDPRHQPQEKGNVHTSWDFAAHTAEVQRSHVS